MSILSPHEAVELAIACAGGHELIAVAEFDSRADVRWARSTLTTNGERTSTSLTVIAFHRRADGVATASLTASAPNRDAVAALVARAQDAAKESSNATDAADLIAGGGASSDWAASPLITSAHALAPITASLGEVFTQALSDEIEHFGYAEHGVTTTWLASTTGLRRRWSQPSGRIEMTAKSHGRSRSAWQGAANENLAAIDVASLDAQLRQGLSWQEARIDIQPGRHTALLTSGAVADLSAEIWWSATARDASEGRSVFSKPGGGTRIGDSLTTRQISLSSDAHDSDMPSCPFSVATSSGSHSSVFDNGLDIASTNWITDGTLTSLVAPRAVAQELGMPTVVSADTVRMTDAAGHGNLAELIARTESALLVTCVWYNRVVDPQTLLLTGLTRDGVYVIRSGEVVGAAGNFRFNESPVGMLNRVTDATSTGRTQPREMADYIHRIAAPALVVNEFNFSTSSDAL
jgi:predicted Zn-dependent protease